MKQQFQVLNLGCVMEHLFKVVLITLFYVGLIVLKCEKQRFEIYMVDWFLHWEGKLYRDVWWVKVERLGLWV